MPYTTFKKKSIYVTLLKRWMKHFLSIETIEKPLVVAFLYGNLLKVSSFSGRYIR